jgi:phage-related protein
VFGAVTKTAFTEMQEASQKSDDLREKIKLLTEQAAVAEKTGLADAGKIEKARDKAISELIARYNLMPPALRQVTMAYDDMKDSWQGFVDQNKPAVYAVMTSGFSSLTAIIPKLQPLFDTGAAAAQRLVAWLARITANGGIDRFVAFLSSQAGPALDHLGTIARNMGVTLGAAFRSTAPAGQGMLAWLAQLSEKAATFAQGGGFERFMATVNANGPGVATALSSLASTVSVLYQAVSPLAPVSLAVAGALGQIISAIPPGVLTTLVAGWIAYSVALKGYRAYVVAAGVASKAWTAAQWLLNVAMSMNPIGLVIIAVVALVAVIALLWTKSAAFRNFWIAVWKHIQLVATTAWTWIRDKAVAAFRLHVQIGASIRARLVSAWKAIQNSAGAAWTWIRAKVTTFYNWITGLPSRISSKLAGMWEGLKTGFRSAVNWVISKMRGLNFTLGGGSFMGLSVPEYTVGFGNIPYLAKGGDVMRDGAAIVGERGPELVSLNRGAQVTPLSRAGGGGGEMRLVIDVRGADTEFGRLIIKSLRKSSGTRSAVRNLIINPA